MGAQFEYFGTWRDSWALVRQFLDRGDIRVLVSRAYESPVPVFFDFPDEALERELKAVPRALLFGSFSKFPPVFRRQEAGPNTGRLYPYIERGGPAIDLLLSRETDSGLIGLGMLSYQSEYWNPVAESWERPSSELKETYRSLVHEIKTVTKRSPLHGNVWIGVDAIEGLRAGRYTMRPVRTGAKATGNSPN